MAQPLKEVDKGKIRTTEADLARANEKIEYWKRVSHANGLQLEAHKNEALLNINLNPTLFTVSSDLKVVPIKAI